MFKRRKYYLYKDPIEEGRREYSYLLYRRENGNLTQEESARLAYHDVNFACTLILKSQNDKGYIDFKGYNQEYIDPEEVKRNRTDELLEKVRNGITLNEVEQQEFEYLKWHYDDLCMHRFMELIMIREITSLSPSEEAELENLRVILTKYYEDMELSTMIQRDYSESTKIPHWLSDPMTKISELLSLESSLRDKKSRK